MSGRTLFFLMAMASMKPVSPGVGQEADSTAAAVLSCFEQSLGSRDSVPECSQGPTLEEILVAPARFHSRTVAALLDGLEKMALSSHRWKVIAAIRLGVAGLPGAAGSGRPLPGIVDRLASVYDGSADKGVRGAVIGRMARQADKPRAIRFLRKAALGAPEPDDGDPWPSTVFEALLQLELMGAEGRDALRELHAEGRVRDETAREYLHHLARHAFGGSYPTGCPPREGPNSRAFEPSDPGALIGTYDLVMVSKWHNDQGMTRVGRLDLWPSDSLHCCNTPEYLRIVDSVVGKQTYARYDYDSITGWRPIPGDEYRRHLYGATSIDLRGMTLGTEAGLDRLASRDPAAPGLVWRRGRLVLAPMRSGFLQVDGATTWLEVDSLTDAGFWGDWRTDFSIWYLTDELGRALPDPSGSFCAIRRER